MRLFIGKLIPICNVNNFRRPVRYILKFLLFVVLGVQLSSCTVPEYITVYNNTNHSIEISFIANRKSNVILVGPGREESYQIGMLVDGDVIVINGNGENMKYRMIHADSDYWSYRGIGPFSSIVFKLQYNNDKRIYILPKGEAYPFEYFSGQPPGYPLTPI